MGGGFQTPQAKRAFSAPVEVSVEGGTPGAASTETREEMLQRKSREAAALRNKLREEADAFNQGGEEQCLNCGS